MDKVTYIKFLERLTRRELEEYLADIWKEKIEINEAQEKWLVEFLERDRLTKGEIYVKVFIFILALLAAVPAYEGAIKRIRQKLTEPKRVDYPWDLIWTTHPEEGEVCELCLALEGKVFGKDFFTKPKLHPFCHCSLERGKKKEVRAMNIRTLDAGAVRAIESEGKRTLEVLAAPFGSADKKDRYKQWFTDKTNFMIGLGDRRPMLYFHGFTPQGRATLEPHTMGTAVLSRIDHEGYWMKGDLPPKGEDELADETWEAALEGRAAASTGAIDYLVRPKRGKDGRYPEGAVRTWAITELSVFDRGDKRIPISDDAIVLPLRALYNDSGISLPSAFEAGDASRAVVDPRNENLENEVNKMDKKTFEELYAEKKAEEMAAQEQKDALRAEIRKELEAEMPKENYREIFSIGGKESARDGKFAFRATREELEMYDKSEIEETDAFMWALMHPRSTNAAAMRVLEETEAAEGAGLIPAPLLNKISALRDEVSIVSKMGIQKMFTPSLTLGVPREDDAMGVFATIAEEGAYVANEPAFSAETVTTVKKGSMITATEEFLADSSIFQPYFVSLCGRKWGLTENLILFTEVKADDTAGTHSATFTQSEIDAFMYQITEPWSDGAHLIMAQATMGIIRGLLVATPRAYGDFSENDGLMKNPFFGYKVHLNSNWEAIGAGDTTLTMSLVNPAAMSWVERAGLSIFVDPYGDSANGRTRFFPRFRAACATTQALGNVSYTDHA